MAAGVARLVIAGCVPRPRAVTSIVRRWSGGCKRSVFSVIIIKMSTSDASVQFFFFLGGASLNCMGKKKTDADFKLNMFVD